MKLSTFANRLAQVVLGTSAFGVYIAANAEIQWPNTPLGATTSAPPLTMLVMSKDHTMFTEAYNDASDVDGDGKLDIRFKPPTSDPKKPGIIYTGLFDPHLCYTHNGTQFNIDSKANQYTKCPGKWSGNWLNYVTTSRIDALRVVLYGGYRKTDTNSETILERAYIPQDGHSWAKEYTSEVVDGYKISDFTPIAAPATGKRHFFGNLTDAKNTDTTSLACTTKSNFDNCSGLSSNGRPPLLRIAENAARITNTKVTPCIDYRNNGTCRTYGPPITTTTVSDMRVWDWASAGRNYNSPGKDTMLFKENYVAEGEDPVRWDNWNTELTNRIVRVEACKLVGDYRSPNCKGYPSNNPSIYKPTGLLHDYAKSMKFGLLTGSYNKPMAGGVLRKVIDDFEGDLKPDNTFDGEVNPTTGVFIANAPLVNTINNIRIRDFNNTKTTNHYRFGGTADIIKPAFDLSPPLTDWGNPVGEMMYEALRYFAGKSGATDTFSTSGSYDADVGLSPATWDDPYKSSSRAKADWCARPNMLVVSGINPSYDSDQLPGSSFAGSISDGLGGGDRADLNVSTIAAKITSEENIANNEYFLGQTTSGNYDGAPTPKTVTSLATVRGLSEEPTKRGSYYAASVANYGKTNDIRPDLVRAEKEKNPVTVDTFAVALSSPLPQIEVPFGNGRKITVVPFGKSYGQHGGAGNSTIDPAKGKEQPTATIVDFYVDYLKENASGDLDEAKFRVNFEDVEQGNDYDMDVIVEYTIKRTTNGINVKVERIADGSGPYMSLGYVISGASAGDNGSYLVVGNKKTTDNKNVPYYLNVPDPNKQNNSVDRVYCNDLSGANNSKLNTCSYLPATSTRQFEVGDATAAASILKDPLWYAAKHGGFVDIDGDKKPNLKAEWDRDGDGTPDSYFLVQNPTKLRESLKRAFDNILERSGSGGNSIANNSTGLSTETFVYQGLFKSDKWSGDLVAYQASEGGVAVLPTWKASEKIPAAADRKIFYGSISSTGALAGKAFTWGNLSDEEKAMLGNEDILNYLRGVRAKETLNGGTLRDRDPKTVLGDISHSSPVYAKDTETVFVGANDGMLHAFDAKNGNERFAYIPSAVRSKLKKIAEPAFNQAHDFFVDGEIAVSTKTQTAYKNYLVATLGRGGKGLFGLNVTDPDSFSGGNSGDWGWEYFPNDDADLGHMLGRPIIAQLQNGTWAVIVGNGYNSTGQKAVLYVFNLATGALIRKIDTGADGDNGLATPGLKTDAYGRVQFAYAGDLKGNVWKFNLNSSTPSDWSIANNVPFFEAGVSQPITAPISLAVDPSTSRLWVHFGTGSDFQKSDPTSTATQSWYGLIDEGSPVERTDLLVAGFDKAGTIDGRSVRTLVEVTASQMVGKKGWVIDLPDTGERMVTASRVYTFTGFSALVGSSVIPVDDPCQPGGRGYLNAVNPFTGGRLQNIFFDMNNDGIFNTDDMLDGVAPSSVDLGIGKPGEPVLIGNRLVVGGSEGEVRDIRINTGSPAAKSGGRISWREIVR